MNWYGFFADAIVVFHFFIVFYLTGGTLYVIAGGIFKWKLVRVFWLRVLHLGLMLYVAAESVLGVWCPFTVWEYRLRVLAGQQVESRMSFVGRLIRHIIFYDFPFWVFILMYVFMAVLVLALWFLVPPEKKKKPQT